MSTHQKHSLVLLALVFLMCMVVGTIDAFVVVAVTPCRPVSTYRMTSLVVMDDHDDHDDNNPQDSSLWKACGRNHAATTIGSDSTWARNEGDSPSLTVDDEEDDHDDEEDNHDDKDDDTLLSAPSLSDYVQGMVQTKIAQANGKTTTSSSTSDLWSRASRAQQQQQDTSNDHKNADDDDNKNNDVQFDLKEYAARMLEKKNKRKQQHELPAADPWDKAAELQARHDVQQAAQLLQAERGQIQRRFAATERAAIQRSYNASSTASTDWQQGIVTTHNAFQ